MSAQSDQVVVEAVPVGKSPDGSMLVVRLREEPTRIWVTPAGELDLTGAPFLDQRLAVAQSRSGCVVLDLRALTFIDCAGLRPILAARHRALSGHHSFEVLCGPGQVARVLHLTGVDRLLGLIGAPPLLPAAADQPTHRAAA